MSDNPWTTQTSSDEPESDVEDEPEPDGDDESISDSELSEALQAGAMDDPEDETELSFEDDQDAEELEELEQEAVEEADELLEEMSESDDEPADSEDSDESEIETEAPEPSVTTVGAEDDQDHSDETEPAQKASQALTSETETDDDFGPMETSGDDVPTPPFSMGGMGPREAENRERRWKLMVWGPPGLFKTHFAFSTPEPVAVIDTEGKAHENVDKYPADQYHIWQPEDFREAQEALQEALKWLRWYKDETGQRGTVVIDSMSLIWEWAKTAYKTEAYPMTDNDEVVLSSNMGSSQDSDWQHIKGMHNSEFREWMTDSEFHFVWTAMETEDYGAVMSGESGDVTPMKPEGEKNNRYKADTIVRARKNDDGEKVGDVTKSNYTDNLIMGLERPTFPKLESAINELRSAETSDDAISKADIEDEIGGSVVRAVPENPTSEDNDD